MTSLIATSEYMYKKMRKIHMVGIGGIGMSGIAELLLNLGYTISGSDVSNSLTIERLRGMGAKITVGHQASNIGDADLLVISSAITNDNEEIKAAREKHVPVIQRAEMLAELMRLKYGIAIAGAHGKTTTTSMISTVLADYNMDPTMVIGGKVITIGSNAKLGRGDFIVVEADESDKSFLRLSPIFEVITNIDKEHMDAYQSMEEIKMTFLEFMKKIPFYGAIVACIDDIIVSELLPELEKKVITYGLNPLADFTAVSIGLKEFTSEFLLIYKGKEINTVTLNVPGLHNIIDSLATVALCHHLDIPFERIIKSLETFQGVERRFQLKGQSKSILLIDDYAHHPTEINAVLDTAKKGWNRKIITIFQPHRYTRTYHLYQEFAEVLAQSDIIIITDIYAASEKPIKGVSTQLIIDEIKKKGHTQCYHVPKVEDVPAMLQKILCHDAIVLTVGAGNLPGIHNKLMEIITSYESE